MNPLRYEMCEQCGGRVPVREEVHDFGPREDAGGRRVEVDVLVCSLGHAFLDPARPAIDPDVPGP